MRQKANLIINELVQLYLETYPDIRYVQALWNLGIIDHRSNLIADRYYEEPVDTLKRCQRNIFKFFVECPQQAKCLDLTQRMTEICK